VWAVGGILYEMLIGRTIDKGRKITELYNYIKAGKQFIPNGVSPLSKTILMECFKYDSRKRINFQALEKLLDSALGPLQQQKLSTIQQPNLTPLHQQPQITQSQIPPSIIQPSIAMMESPPSAIQSPPSNIQLPPQQLIPTPIQQPLKTSLPNPILQSNIPVSMPVPQPPVQTSFLRPPTNYPPETRPIINSINDPTLKPNQLYQPIIQISQSKGPINIPRSTRATFPLGPLNAEMKDGIIDEDSWLASQFRQKDFPKRSMPQSKLSNVPVAQSIGTLPVNPTTNLQPSQQSTLQSMIVSPTTRIQPVPLRNRSPDLLTSKMPPPIQPNRALAPTNYMINQNFYR